MQILANGLLLIVNGTLSTVHTVASPISIAVVVCAGALAMLARLEIKEVSRQGIKPTIERH
jgi:hypothetical protein